MRNNPEYALYKQVSTYLKYQYPKILYHFDYAGLNLSKAQAGQMKAIQHSKGYPDLVILEKRGGFGCLFIELKPEGTKLYKRDGSPATPHIGEQIECMMQLDSRGYAVAFGIGFDATAKIITNYLNLKP